jgi:hypothetical protein
VKRVAPFLAVVVVALIACGGSSGAIDAAAAHELAGRMASLRSAVDAGDRRAAAAALQALEREVIALRDEGSIAPDRADDILSAASQVSALLPALPAPSPSVSLAPSPTKAPPPPHGEAHGHEEHGGHGHGHGPHDEGHGGKGD